MNHKDLQTAAERTNETEETRVEALVRVADMIAKDSSEDAAEYLSQTEVPHGGE
jgi:hypothetical protein